MGIWEKGTECWMWIFFAGGLLTLSWTDLKRRVIPNGVLIALAGNRMIWLVLLRQPVLRVLGEMVPGCLMLGTLFLAAGAAEQFGQRRIMGGGDRKLLLVLGLYLNWAQLLLTLFAGCLLGVLAGIPCRGRKKGSTVPLGPFLSAGAVLTLCLGGPVIRWYLTMLG